MANMATESKRELINQLESQGWTLTDIIGKVWTMENGYGDTAKIEVTVHKDGRQADYEIIEQHEAEDDWEAEQAAQIKNELEHEIATLKERIERKERVGYFEGKRGQAMRRHYERKLANAKALHAELFGDGGAEDEIAQAAQVVKDAGGMAVLPENRERFDAQLKQLHNAEGARDAALEKLNKLTGAIEDMKLDCDAEVYDMLLEITDILGR